MKGRWKSVLNTHIPTLIHNSVYFGSVESFFDNTFSVCQKLKDIFIVSGAGGGSRTRTSWLATNCSTAKLRPQVSANSITWISSLFQCAPARTRTWNLHVRSVALYPLSYKGFIHLPKMFNQQTLPKKHLSKIHCTVSCEDTQTSFIIRSFFNR